VEFIKTAVLVDSSQASIKHRQAYPSIDNISWESSWRKFGAKLKLSQIM